VEGLKEFNHLNHVMLNNPKLHPSLNPIQPLNHVLSGSPSLTWFSDMEGRDLLERGLRVHGALTQSLLMKSPRPIPNRDAATHLRQSTKVVERSARKPLECLMLSLSLQRPLSQR
jgi:hypothetical protein